jgi:membrane protein implicated in regulation of membrane protease activity
LLLQVPGWALMAMVLAMLWEWFGLSLWISGLIFFAWVVKDFILFPLVRTAFESQSKTGIEELIGITGIAWEQIQPRGYIKVRGELWPAEIEEGQASIPAGSVIRIRAARGFTLIVAPESEFPLTENRHPPTDQ